MTAPIAPEQHDRLPAVAEVCPDDAAVLGLCVMRFVAAGYMTGDVAPWDAAHDRVERVLDAGCGGRLVAAMTGLLRALRTERRMGWSFLPATCCRALPHEVRLMAALTLARAGRWGEAAHETAGLSGAVQAPRLEAAIGAAAGVLNECQARLDGAVPLPAEGGLDAAPVVLH